MASGPPQENNMNAMKKDGLMMSATLASAALMLVLGSASSMAERGRGLEAVSNALQQAAVRPPATEVPAVVVKAPLAAKTMPKAV
jgi:hypothetical protein